MAVPTPGDESGLPLNAQHPAEQNHQGIGNELIDGEPTSTGDIVCDERLGGLNPPNAGCGN